MSHLILFAGLKHMFFGIVLTVTAIFLILLVLVQRGRGGGLAGAFGGMGGQSAFGTKAGDTFTRITIGVSLFWILMCVAAVRFMSAPTDIFGTGPARIGAGAVDVPNTPAAVPTESPSPGNSEVDANATESDAFPAAGTAAPETMDSEPTGPEPN